MSSAGQITVNITAREADLRAELAVAKADLAAFSAQVNSISKEMVSTGKTADATLNASLRSATTGAAQAGRSVSGLTAELKKIAPAAREGHGAISTATREFRALFDELTSGRTRMTPGTLAIIATRVFGLSGAALAGVAAVGALALGIGALGFASIKASEALDELKVKADVSGDFNVTRESIKGVRADMGTLPDISRTAAQEVIAAFEGMGQMSGQSLDGLSRATATWSQVSGEKTEDVSKKFIKLMEDESLSVKKVQEVFPFLTTAEADNFVQVQKLGDANKTTAALMDIVAKKTHEMSSEVDNNTNHITKGWQEIKILGGAIMGLRTFTEAWNAVTSTNTQLLDKQADALKRDSAALRDMAANTARAFSQDVDAAQHSTLGRMDELKASIKRYQADLANPDATEKQKALFRSMIEDDKKSLAQLQNKDAFGGTGFSNAGAKAIANARETISEIQSDENLSAQQRKDREKQVWESVLATAKLNAAQRVEVQTEMNRELAQADRAIKQEQVQISRDNSSTQLQISRIGIQEKRDLLEQEVQEGRITEQAKLAQLRELAQAEGAANLAMLDSSLKTYENDLVGYTRVQNQKKVIMAQTAAEIAKIDEQIAAANDKAAKADSQSWKSAVGVITSAEDTFTNSLLSGRYTALQSLQAATSQFLKKELQEDIAYYTRKMLLSKTAFAADKANEQGGLLVHALTETQKTAATTTGESIRLATKESASSAASATEVSSGSAQIMNDAHKAFSGAYSAVVGIPYVGPILAPIAGATAFAAVAAMDTLTSLDVGAWNVPKDMPAFIHKGESVVPKTFAEGLRSNGGMGLPGNNTTSTTNLNYSPTVNAPQNKSLGQMLTDEASTMRAWLHAQTRSGSLKMGAR